MDVNLKEQHGQEELLTVQEVADILKVPRSWIYSRTRANKIAHIKCGKYCRFRLSEVMAGLENGREI